MMAKRRLTEDPGLTNLFGPLDATLRRRLRQVLHDPKRYWDRDHGLILNGTTFVTLWQAILAVDPTFQREGKTTDQAGRVVRDWARYPDSVLIGRAIRFALGGGKVR